MKNILLTLHAVLLVMGLAAGNAAWANNDLPEPYDSSFQTGGTSYSPEELDDLLAPIALYPDPLIAQILPAATFVDQIDDAARYVRQYGRAARIEDQPWDVSVKAVAHYPSVLFMMDKKYDWTVSLGQAYIDQEQDVLDAIQYLRAEATKAGNLISNPQQQVVVEDEYIRIYPAEPQVIYVPEYDPLLVYVAGPSPAYGFISFGIGFTIGAWLNRDTDWQRHRVYYHGWEGGGWVSRARPHVQVRNSVYINNSYTVINTNRRVLQHDTVRYREKIHRDVQVRRERIGRQLPSHRVEQSRPEPPVRVIQPRQVVNGSRSPVHLEERDIYRGRDVQRTQPASRSGYGGYGSRKDASSYRERGQASRENMRQNIRQQPPQSLQPTPVRRGQPAAVPRPAPQPRPAVKQPAPVKTPPASRGGEERRHER
jgi:hypothetical protein